MNHTYTATCTCREYKRNYSNTSSRSWPSTEISSYPARSKRQPSCNTKSRVWTLWDSGSTTTGINPTYAQMADIAISRLSEEYILQLGTVRS
ncbi:hypothetical protein BDQ17DRAFT_1256545 [Cyathus striatus]|nr:hypothetical protein BDQ17DRAFT_1256545 [Cyathus striatus]